MDSLLWISAEGRLCCSLRILLILKMTLKLQSLLFRLKHMTTMQLTICLKEDQPSISFVSFLVELATWVNPLNVTVAIGKPPNTNTSIKISVSRIAQLDCMKYWLPMFRLVTSANHHVQLVLSMLPTVRLVFPAIYFMKKIELAMK